MARPYAIACLYCHRQGTVFDLHSNGWSFAPNQPFAYICDNCSHKDMRRD